MYQAFRARLRSEEVACDLIHPAKMAQSRADEINDELKKSKDQDDVPDAEPLAFDLADFNKGLYL